DGRWMVSGRTDAETYFSPLSSINIANVAQLGLAWYLDLPGERALQATPLEIDGVLYFSGANGKAYAVDARSGKQLWKFDPDLATHPPSHGVIHGSNRGVGFWEDKVYV